MPSSLWQFGRWSWMEEAAVHGGVLEHCVQQFLAGGMESLHESVKRYI
jgi:hypothetical protein